MSEFEKHLLASQRIHVQQVLEAWEVVLNFETRNKYRILDESKRPLAFAAEQSTGLGGIIGRQFLGHWRSFKISIFDENRNKIYDLDFPFRWFFKTLYLRNTQGQMLGHLQQRFAIFRKKFDVHDKHGRIIARINSSFFKFWTFEFYFNRKKLGTVQKKWSGALSEIFTDKDNFVVSFADKDLDLETKALMLSTCLMVDIIYFENNQGKKGGLLEMID